MPAAPILTLDPSWEITEINRVPGADLGQPLGDGYDQAVVGGQIEQLWQITAPLRSVAQRDALLAELGQYQGDRPFRWSPDTAVYPLATYYCPEGWSVTYDGPNTFTLSAQFELDWAGECEVYRDFVSPAVLATEISAAYTWLASYFSPTSPYAISAGGLAPEKFTPGDYTDWAGLHPQVGSIDTNANLIRALLAARPYLSTLNSATALTIATTMAGAVESTFYRGTLAGLPCSWANTTSGAIPSEGLNNSGQLGYLGGGFPFVNGFSTSHPSFLSRVFRVYSVGSLPVYPQSRAKTLDGTEWAVQYWVTDFGVNSGPKFRAYRNNALQPTSTTDPLGQVVLLGNNGNSSLAVSYTDWSGPQIAAGALVAQYPIVRPPLSGEVEYTTIAADDLDQAFAALATATGLAKWSTAQTSHRTALVTASTVPNPRYLWRKQPGAFPNAWPGTGVLPQIVTTRATDGSMDFVNTTALTDVVIYSGNTLIEWGSGLTLTGEVSSTAAQLLEIRVNLSSSFTSTSQTFTAYRQLPAAPGLAWTSLSFGLSDFVRWGLYNTWEPFGGVIVNASTGGGSASSANLVESTGLLRRVTLARGLGNAIAELQLTAATRPHVLRYRLTQGTCNYVVDGVSWPLTPGGAWQTLTPSGPLNTVSVAQLVATSPNAVVDVAWVGEGPTTPPTGSTVYRVDLRSRLNAAWTIRVGDWQFGASQPLPYNPGVLPHIIRNGVGERGALVADQRPAIWARWGETARLDQLIAFLSDSQRAYYQLNPFGAYGMFAPCYRWAIVAGGDRGNLDRWSWEFDGDASTTDFYGVAGCIASAAEAWFLLPGEASLKLIVMDALGALDRLITATGQPVVSVPAQGQPTRGNHPGCAALIARAALWANLAGGDPAITFRLLKRSRAWLATQVASGGMAGSYSLNTPNTYRPAWHADVMATFALIAARSVDLRLPGCDVVV